MSTIAEKKAACGYTAKVIPSTCGNCAHFKSDRALLGWMEASNKRCSFPYYMAENDGVEKNLRCARHGFSVKKMAACNDWAPNQEGGAA